MVSPDARSSCRKPGRTTPCVRSTATPRSLRRTPQAESTFGDPLTAVAVRIVVRFRHRSEHPFCGVADGVELVVRQVIDEQLPNGVDVPWGGGFDLLAAGGGDGDERAAPVR